MQSTYYILFLRYYSRSSYLALSTTHALTSVAYSSNQPFSFLVFFFIPPAFSHPFTLGLCGDEGTRTPDLRRAKAALSQLSYIPFLPHGMGLSGLEPETSPLSEERSNQLS